MTEHIAECQMLFKNGQSETNDDSDSDHQYFQDLQDELDEDLREERLVNEMAREMGEDNDFTKF